MSLEDQLTSNIAKIEKILRYDFKNKQLLFEAFIHRSFTNENRLLPYNHNERLEFLGDSVLGLIVAEYLFQNFPNTDEGKLSTLRAKLVEAAACKQYISQLKLEQYLLLGRGEQLSFGRGRDSILANAFEAIIGAIYLDGGLEKVKDFFFLNFSETIKEILSSPKKNWKALLQDFSQKNYQQTPTYITVKEEGPDHQKTFEVEVYIEDKKYGKGSGNTKKQAQQKAAFQALINLGEIENGQS